MTKPVFEIDDLPSEPVAKPDAEKLADAMAWSAELRRIIAEFKDGDESPLNKGEVRDLLKIIHAKIDLIEGLITEEEYNGRLCVDSEPIAKVGRALATKYARIVFENPVPPDMTLKEFAEILQGEIESLLQDHGVLADDVEIHGKPYIGEV